MPFQQTSYDRTAVNRALEIAINLGLAILLTAACLLILLPFIRRAPGTRTRRGDGLKIFWMGTLGFGAAFVRSGYGRQRGRAFRIATGVGRGDGPA